MSTLLRVVAVVWLVLVGPFDLAATMARLLPRLFGAPDLLLIAVVLARAGTVGLGVAVGVALWRRADGILVLARLWLVAECLTLASIWTTAIVPSNVAPGMRLPVVVLYAALAGCVWLAARRFP